MTLIGFAGSAEEHDRVVLHDVLNKVSLFLLEQVFAFVHEMRQLGQFPAVVLQLLIFRAAVDYQNGPLLDISERSEGLQQTPEQLWQLVSPSLRDMTFVNHQ